MSQPPHRGHPLPKFTEDDLSPVAPTPPFRLVLDAALACHGLLLRGGWRPGPQDLVPPFPGGKKAAVVWMVGGIGSQLWPAFKASPFFQDGLAHPLDRWSQDIGEALANRWGGVALYPFEGPPHYPFQQWATRAEQLQSSPMMLRIHPKHGLWHAYRFALALAEVLPGDLQLTSSTQEAHKPDLCLTCVGQPCLRVCPVQAYTGTTFELNACAAHLKTVEGKACMQMGCMARRACPVGQQHTYVPEHAALHMNAFVNIR